MRLHKVPYVHLSKIGRFVVRDSSELSDANDEGEVLVGYDQLGRYEQRAVIAITRKALSIDGAVLKFARKSMGLRQPVMAELLGYSEFQLSRMENDHERVPRAVQYAVAGIVSRVYEEGEGVLKELLGRRREATRFEISA
jgi:DNA-binding transcriptional regulator YiaG